MRQEVTLLEQAFCPVWLDSTDGADSTKDSYALAHVQPTLLNGKTSWYSSWTL